MVAPDPVGDALVAGIVATAFGLVALLLVGVAIGVYARYDYRRALRGRTRLSRGAN